MDGVTQFYLAAAAVLIVGVLWFRVVRPMLEGFGIIRDVNDMPRAEPVIMSRSEPAPPPSAPVVPTDEARTDAGRTDAAPTWTRQQLLTHYMWLRRLGAKRDEARPYLKAMGIPLHNDLWSQAAPPPASEDDGDLMVTPIAGRVTRRSYYDDDPELRYTPPA